MGAVLLRPADEIFRYGGEEFAIIMPQTGKEQALSVAERVREAVSDLRIPHCKCLWSCDHQHWGCRH